MDRVMKNQGDHQRTKRVFRLPTDVVATFLAGIVGLACSSSSLKTSAHDAGGASGGQAGSISGGVTGGAGGAGGPVRAGGVSTGGTIGSGGAGGSIVGNTGGTIGPGREGGASTVATGGNSGTSGPGGAGGIRGTGGTCASFRMCNGGDSQLGYGGFEIDPSVGCPTERECYVLQYGCGNTFCMLPEGVHCTDKLTCNPGDMETSSDAPDCSKYQGCYIKQLCASEIWCKHATDAGVDVSASATGMDTGASDAEVWDASEPESGVDATYVPSCGNAIVDPGEYCDLGSLNGWCLDSHLNSVNFGCAANWTTYCPCPGDTQEFCTANCQVPKPLLP
jgi:hypothetical protein